MTDDYTPTTGDVRFGYAMHSSGRNARRAADGQGTLLGVHFNEFNRWLSAHDAEVRAAEMSDWAQTVLDAGKQGERIGRASVLAEQGEPEGQRWFSAAYRAQSGHVIPIDAPSTLQWAAERVRDEYRREDPEGPDYFLASRILPPWLPVEENKPESTDGSER